MIISEKMKIYTYTAAEISTTLASRLFQVLCTWYLIQLLGREDLMADVLLVLWLTNSLFLLISGFINIITF